MHEAIIRPLPGMRNHIRLITAAVSLMAVLLMRHCCYQVTRMTNVSLR